MGIAFEILWRVAAAIVTIGLPGYMAAWWCYANDFKPTRWHYVGCGIYTACMATLIIIG